MQPGFHLFSLNISLHFIRTGQVRGLLGKTYPLPDSRSSDFVGLLFAWQTVFGNQISPLAFLVWCDSPSLIAIVWLLIKTLSLPIKELLACFSLSFFYCHPFLFFFSFSFLLPVLSQPGEFLFKSSVWIVWHSWLPAAFYQVTIFNWMTTIRVPFCWLVCIVYVAFFFLSSSYLYSTKKDLVTRYLIDCKASNMKENLSSLAGFWQRSVASCTWWNRTTERVAKSLLLSNNETMYFSYTLFIMKVTLLQLKLF